MKPKRRIPSFDEVAAPSGEVVSPGSSVILAAPSWCAGRVLSKLRDPKSEGSCPTCDNPQIPEEAWRLQSRKRCHDQAVLMRKIGWFEKASSASQASTVGAVLDR